MTPGLVRRLLSWVEVEEEMRPVHIPCSPVVDTPSAASLGTISFPFVGKRLEIITEVQQRRIILVALPELGHLNPIVHMGHELAQRGHEVLLASCAFIEPKIAKQCEDFGVKFVGLAEDVMSPETLGSPAKDLKDHGRTLGLYAYYNNAMGSSLRALAKKSRSQAIIADFMTYCAGPVCEEFGIPLAVNFADPCLLNVLGPSPGPLIAVFAPVLAWLGGAIAASDMPSASKIFKFMIKAIYQDQCFCNSFWGLQPAGLMPPNIIWTGPTAPRSEVALQETSFQALNEWIAWVRQEELRVVYVTFGSMITLNAKQVSAIFEGLSAVPGIAVAWSLREAAQKHLPYLQKKFFVHHWFPQAEVLRLPEVTAVITHCGFGGLSDIMMAGKVVVGVPFFGDQPFNAQQVEAQGFGEVVLPSKLTPSTVQRVVSSVIKNENYLAKAKQMQAALMTSGGAWLCSMYIEHLATHGCAHLKRKTPSLGASVARGVGTLIACSVVFGLVVRIFRR